jgi:peptidoglycan/LPS O-acetylase OafA/YrhL
LPDPDGSWQYAALQARRSRVVFAALAALTVLLLAAALVAELWDHSHHKNYDPGLWLSLAAFPAFFAFCARPAANSYRKLDQAANRRPGSLAPRIRHRKPNSR